MKKAIFSVLCIYSFTVYSQVDSSSLKPVTLEKVVIEGIRAEKTTPVTQKTIRLDQINKVYLGEDATILIEKLSPSILSFSDAGTAYGNYNQFRLRSIDQTRVNITLNGVPLNDMIDQGVFFSNFTDFGNSVESIQIQRGVGTSTNGTASYAGSVNFESIRLNDTAPSAEINFLGGSFDTYRLSAEVKTGKLENDLSFYGRYTRTLSEGFKNHSGSDAQSFFFSGGYLGEKDIVKITAFAGKTQNDQAYLPVPLSVINEDPQTNLNDPNDTDDFEQEFIQLQYSRVLSDRWTGNGSLYYGGARGVFPFGFGDGQTQLNFGLQNDHFGFIGDVHYENHGWEVKSGLHTYVFQRKNFTYLAPNSAMPSYNDETEKNELSVFTKFSKKIGSFEFFGDFQIRYVNLEFRAQTLEQLAGDSEATRDWFFFNPKIGVSYAVEPNALLYLSFGRTGREPTRTDILGGSDFAEIIAENFQRVTNEDSVQAEFVNDLEVGYRYSGPQLHLSVNYFFLSFKDEISLVGGLANNSYVQLRKNIDQSTRSGLEIDLAYTFNKRWSASFMATFQQTNVDEFVNQAGEVFTDVNHIFAPTFMGELTGNYTPLPSLTLSLSGRYVGESFMELGNDGDFLLPDFFVMSSKVTWSATDWLQLGFTANNLLDEQYFTDGAPVDIDFDGTVDGPGFRIQPPRHYYGSVQVRF